MAKRVLKEVVLEWCKFVNPDDKYGFRQCNAVLTKEQVAFLKEQGVTSCKVDKEGRDYILLRQRKEDFDGKKTGPVPVVGKDLSPIDASTVGNGSTANVLVDIYPYKANGGGISIRLEQVQILNHVVFGDNESLEAVGDEEFSEENPF